jgi:hypothetical protein
MLPVNEVLKGVWMVNWETRNRNLMQLGFEVNFIEIADFRYARALSSCNEVTERFARTLGSPQRKSLESSGVESVGSRAQ